MWNRFRLWANKNEIKIITVIVCILGCYILIKGMNAYVNLIPYNATEHLQFQRSNSLNIAKFYDILKKNNICVTIRREFGSKISAACGQLRSKKEEV